MEIQTFQNSFPPESSGGQICATEDARIMEDVTMPNRRIRWNPWWVDGESDRWEFDRFIYDRWAPTIVTIW